MDLKMRTLVLQSFRTFDVPAWLHVCMNSVQSWANAKKWDYLCLDDSLFNFASAEVTEHCKNNIYALTDVCRLTAIKHYLNQGYERVILGCTEIPLALDHMGAERLNRSLDATSALASFCVDWSLSTHPLQAA